MHKNITDLEEHLLLRQLAGRTKKKGEKTIIAFHRGSGHEKCIRFRGFSRIRLLYVLSSVYCHCIRRCSHSPSPQASLSRAPWGIGEPIFDIEKYAVSLLVVPLFRERGRGQRGGEGKEDHSATVAALLSPNFSSAHLIERASKHGRSAATRVLYDIEYGC